jgi:hypothetical protein
VKLFFLARHFSASANGRIWRCILARWFGASASCKPKYSVYDIARPVGGALKLAQTSHRISISSYSHFSSTKEKGTVISHFSSSPAVLLPFFLDNGEVLLPSALLPWPCHHKHISILQ